MLMAVDCGACCSATRPASISSLSQPLESLDTDPAFLGNYVMFLYLHYSIAGFKAEGFKVFLRVYPSLEGYSIL